MLLLVRVVLYITASVTVSVNPQTSVLVTIVTVGGLLSLSTTSVYKNMLVDVVDKCFTSTFLLSLLLIRTISAKLTLTIKSGPCSLHIYHHNPHPSCWSDYLSYIFAGEKE